MFQAQCKALTCMISFDPYNSPMSRYGTRVPLPDRDTESQRTDLLCSTSHLASNWWNQVGELKSPFGFQAQGLHPLCSSVSAKVWD